MIVYDADPAAEPVLDQIPADYGLEYGVTRPLSLSNTNTNTNTVQTIRSIRTVRVSDPNIYRSIGAKRNYGCRCCYGSIITHWDDDDWSAPTRVEEQVQSLLSVPQAVMCGYRTMIFADGRPDGYYLYDGTPGTIIGSSLMFRRSWWEAGHRFPEWRTEKGANEDSGLVHQTERRERVVLDDCRVMYATNHPGNTSPRGRETYSWKKVGRPEWFVDHPALDGKTAPDGNRQQAEYQADVREIGR